MTHHPLSRPTVYVESVPALRWRLTLIRLGRRSRIRRTVGAGVLALLVAGLGLL